MSESSQFDRVRAAAEYVRQHPGCIQSNVIEHIMRGRSYGLARRCVKSAIDAGLITASQEGNCLYLYPPQAAEKAPEEASGDAGKRKNKERTPQEILERYLKRNKRWSPTGKSRSARTVSGGLPTLGKRHK